MHDALDALIARMSRLPASAQVGALDEENAQKLARQEFGTRTAPMRPTLSAATDRAEGAINRAIARRVGMVIDGADARDGEVLLGEVGEMLAEEVRDAIDNNTPPPLAPSTIANRRRRGNESTRTLVDSGKMRLSIRVETKRGAGKGERGGW